MSWMVKYAFLISLNTMLKNWNTHNFVILSQMDDTNYMRCLALTSQNRIRRRS